MLLVLFHLSCRLKELMNEPIKLIWIFRELAPKGIHKFHFAYHLIPVSVGQLEKA